MAWIWTGMVAAAVLCGSWTGQEAAVAAAAVEGAQGAIELCISLAGMMCLWTGVMEIMRRSGLAEKLSRLLRPVLGLIFPQTARDREIMDSIAANVSANLLGLETRPPRWASRRPEKWGGGARGRPLTPCVCWWCAIRRLSS